MNEAQTRAKLIDPALKKSGWDVVINSDILREHKITKGRIQMGGRRARPLSVDYILIYKERKLAVIEAKSDEEEVSEGVGQAKNYAQKLGLKTTYSTNGKKIYQICMETGKEGLIKKFPTPQELWNRTFIKEKEIKEKFSEISKGGTYTPYFFQEIAVNKTLDAIGEGKNRILLTLATGTGKTTIAFQICWKLFQARWNIKNDWRRRPRILFLTDRNNLANQAFNEFSSFPDDAMIRIKPSEIKRNGKVPKNGSIFFTIFQTFMSGDKNIPYFGQYPKDYFDLIIIDECHRGGANDEGNWRGILEYFKPSLQIGLTATPKREENADTYRYFGKPLYTYSLKEGIIDGFLTPFRVKKITTSLDAYIHVEEDTVISGNVETNKIYEEKHFNKIINIDEREKKRVKILLEQINQTEKTIIFCRTQKHASEIRDFINQMKESEEPNYCVRVTADDGILGDEHLENFRDNEKIIPTILTTSQKLSTGVDAKNVRNIVLLRPINSIIEFKQIVGRGTRIFEGKDFFTIYDFVKAYQHFKDPEWDGEPLEPESIKKSDYLKLEESTPKYGKKEKIEKIKIKLKDGKEREIQHMIETSFWTLSGKTITLEQFIQEIYGKLPQFFKTEKELRKIWSKPQTRKALLNKLEEEGYGIEQLKKLKEVINAQNSDIFDVLEYISFNIKPITRKERVTKAKENIFKTLNTKQKDFIEFILEKYVEIGIEELGQDKLPQLIKIKYKTPKDATNILGNIKLIKKTFIDFQKHLFYSN